jgi:GNAT superfamily N-acetyltransferase
MDIRLAVQRDGAELLRAMADAPQRLNNLVVTLLNEPDYFARARAYDNATIFVAEDDGEIAGSAACAIRDVLIDGQWRQAGYEFQYFTAANHRRKGVAGRLHDAIEAHLRRKGVALSTAIISANNDPSLRFFEGTGFAPHRDLNVYFLTVFPHLDLQTGRTVRAAKTADLPAIANLINTTWSSHDHFTPASPGSLLGFLDRTPGPRADRMLVLEERGEIVACAGLWDWSRVQQIRVVAVEAAPAGQPQRFQPGQTFKQWGISPVGFRDPADLVLLLRHAGNRALAHGVDRIGLVADTTDDLARTLQPMADVVTPLRFYAKPLTPDTTAGTRPLFVDIIDL